MLSNISKAFSNLYIRATTDIFPSMDKEQHFARLSVVHVYFCTRSSLRLFFSSGISWYKAMFLIVNAALGAGLLNFPRAFHEAGGIVTGNLVHGVSTVHLYLYIEIL